MPGKNIDPVRTGKFIAKLRKERHLTQDDLGDMIFISRKSISKWETGKCCPSIDMLKKLSEVLGVSLEELIAGEFFERPKEPDEVVVKEPETEFVFKVLRSRWFKIFSLGLCIFVFILITVSFVHNLSADKVYLINYEGDYFTISKGTIVISDERSYINVGNLYSDIMGVDSNTKYDVELYFLNEETNEEELLVDFNTENSIVLDKTVSDNLKSIFKNGDSDKLYYRITFVNKKGDEYTYNLKLVITESAKSEEEDSKDTTEEFVDDDSDKVITGIDMKFLFELSDEKIEKCLSGKRIKIGTAEYNIAYDSSASSLSFSSKDDWIFISLVGRRISFHNNEIETIIVGESNIVKLTDLSENNFDTLQKVISQLQNLLNRYKK